MVVQTTSGKVPLVMIVAALLPDLGIGFRGGMPWKLKQEMKYFKNVTTTTTGTCGTSGDGGKINAVIMGRKTWESIPAKFRPLPGRLNIVLSRNFSDEGDKGEETVGGKDGFGKVWFKNSLEAALRLVEERGANIDKIFVMGGAEIYNKLAGDDRVQHLLLTEIRSKKGLVETDTKLDFAVYGEGSQWSQQTTEDLVNFTGVDVRDAEIDEGDFSYKFTYWRKLQSK